MSQTRTLKVIFFILWLVLLAAVSAAIYFQDRFFINNTKPIANLQNMQGSVLVRSEGLIRWQETVAGQGVFDGDRVATGKSSGSMVSFGQGRSLKLGEDTQIQITGILQSNNDYAFMITLLRGTLTAEINSKCSGCPPLIIRTDGNTYNIAAGEQIGLFKEVGKKAKLFDPKNPWPKSDEKKVALIDESFFHLSKPPEPVKIERPPPPPPPPEVESAAGMEAALVSPVSGSYWSTLNSIEAVAQESLDFKLKMAPLLPKEGKWQPVVEISGAGGTGSKELILGASAADLNLKIPIETIAKVATPSMKGGVKDYTFSVRGGAVISQPIGKSTSVSPAFSEFRIRSYGSFNAGPIAILFDKMQADYTGGSWLKPKRDLSLQEAPVAIYLKSGADVARFFPFMRGSEALGLAEYTRFSDVGIFIVRDLEIIAQIGGSLSDSKTLTSVAAALQADFAFKGSRAALLDTRRKSKNDLINWVDALLDKGEILYIMKRTKIYPVSRTFIKTSREVANFIDSQARAVFLENVEIIYHR